MTPILDAEVPTQSSTPHNAEVDQTNKVYLLPSDEVEKERLAIQHSIILEGTGGKLVHAPVTLDEKSSVLESATGSGIWLQDLAKIVPVTTELVGIDIQSKTFPKPSALPPNMQFRVQSVVDLPKEWTNKFDFVHQRLLCLGLRDADWHRALGEIYRVLKPGGWFQWLEIDNLEQMGPTMKIFSHLLQRTADLRGMEGSWPGGSIKWQRFIEEAGFVNIRITWHYAPIGGWAGEKGILGKKNIVQVYRSTNKATIEFGLVDEEESDKLFQELDKEIDSSSGLRNVYVMLCAQKAAE